MNAILRSMSLTYAAGSIGGLVNSLAVWGFGVLGITTALGAKLAPQFTVGFLYAKLVWGGLWGLLFLVPLFRDCWITRGIIVSIPPTLAQLLWVFPLKLGKGWLGLDLGLTTPLFVVLFNMIWGLAAAWWLSRVEGPTRR